MSKRHKPAKLAIEVELERESYPPGTDPLCRGVVRFSVPRGSPLLRRPVKTHLCLVLDISGSMDVPDKYPMLLEAVRLLCASLREGQRVTLIVFSDEAEVVGAAIDSGQAARQVDQTIELIEATPFRFGQTYLEPGLELALEAITNARARWPQMLQRLYVLTDGQLDDTTRCHRFTRYLKDLDVEFSSYGFGDDFALGTMRSIIGGCAGGAVKPVPDGATLRETFQHLARVGQRVVASSAEVELLFEPGVIAGDTFIHRPVPRWFARDPLEANPSVPVGPIEARRTYVLAFEARVAQVSEPLNRLGEVRIRYETALGPAEDSAPLPVRFEPGDNGEGGPVCARVRQVLDDVTALRDRDAETLLQAYRARIAIFRREYRDHETIASLERAVETLERTGSLDELAEKERREVEVDQNSIIVEDLTRRSGGGRDAN